MLAYAKPLVTYGDPIAMPKTKWRFRPLPARPVSQPGNELVCSLEDVAPRAINCVTEEQQLIFHAVGYTGTDASDVMQLAIARAMQHQIRRGQAADALAKPSFLYILGDVVYPLGES